MVDIDRTSRRWALYVIGLFEFLCKFEQSSRHLRTSSLKILNFFNISFAYEKKFFEDAIEKNVFTFDAE